MSAAPAVAGQQHRRLLQKGHREKNCSFHSSQNFLIKSLKKQKMTK
jgi:hypothetical protein